MGDLTVTREAEFAQIWAGHGCGLAKKMTVGIAMKVVEGDAGLS